MLIVLQVMAKTAEWWSGLTSVYIHVYIYIGRTLHPCVTVCVGVGVCGCVGGHTQGLLNIIHHPVHTFTVYTTVGVKLVLELYYNYAIVYA